MKKPPIFGINQIINRKHGTRNTEPFKLQTFQTFQTSNLNNQSTSLIKKEPAEFQLLKFSRL